MVARHFNASDFHVLFTSGATAGCKLLSELYPWKSSTNQERTFCYASSSHNSVIGMRKRAPRFFSFDADSLTSMSLPAAAEAHIATDSLMCFPAQCNFSGAKYSLENIALWQSKGFRVLLDAASFVGTSPLDLSKYKPDYVVLSFYKMFGFPTGLGALLIRKSPSTAELAKNKAYFGGGTIGAILYDKDWSMFRERLEESLEDGTINFQAIAALKHGFAALSQIGTISSISRHVFSHAHILAHGLSALTHWNGSKVVELYGWSEEKLSSSSSNLSSLHEKHGGVVTFNIKRSDNSWVGHNEVDRLASQEGFQLRTGCFCNPGSCQTYLKLTSEMIMANYEKGARCWDENDVTDGFPTGAVRVSFPYFCQPSDALSFLEFIKAHFLERNPPQTETQAITGVQTTAKLDKICVFPVKSCGGFEVDEWHITSEGLEYDREWMLVDQGGRFVSQKAEPNLSLISTRIEDRILAISAPSMPVLSINIDELPEEELDLQVCGDVCSGRVYPRAVCDWFSLFLGSDPLFLVRNAPDSDRKAKRTCNGSEANEILADRSVRFVNESQFLIVNRSSLDDLKSRLMTTSLEDSDLGGEKKEESANRRLSNLRWNLVIEGPPALDEDRWISLSIGSEHHLTISGDCARCRMITIDPSTGLSSREPLHTLSMYRRKHGRVIFGVLAVHEPTLNPQLIKVGMPVQIVSRPVTD